MGATTRAAEANIIEYKKQSVRTSSLDANKMLVELNYNKWYNKAQDKDYLQNAVLEILLSESNLDENAAKKIITKWQLRGQQYKKIYEYAHTSIETDHPLPAQGE